MSTIIQLSSFSLLLRGISTVITSHEELAHMKFKLGRSILMNGWSLIFVSELQIIWEIQVETQEIQMGHSLST